MFVSWNICVKFCYHLFRKTNAPQKDLIFLWTFHFPLHRERLLRWWSLCLAVLGYNQDTLPYEGVAYPTTYTTPHTSCTDVSTFVGSCPYSFSYGTPLTDTYCKGLVVPFQQSGHNTPLPGLVGCTTTITVSHRLHCRKYLLLIIVILL